MLPTLNKKLLYFPMKWCPVRWKFVLVMKKSNNCVQGTKLHINNCPLGTTIFPVGIYNYFIMKKCIRCIILISVQRSSSEIFSQLRFHCFIKLMRLKKKDIWKLKRTISNVSSLVIIHKGKANSLFYDMKFFVSLLCHFLLCLWDGKKNQIWIVFCFIHFTSMFTLVLLI
jgi:hypothetical protein